MDSVRLKVAPNPSLLGVERGQRNSSNCGGQREGQIHKRIYDALAGKVVPRQYPSQQHSEDCGE